MIKKIMKISMFLLIMCNVFINSFIKVNAASNDTNVVHYWVPGIFSHKTNDINKFSQLSYIYANGVLAYCIEPGVELFEGTYSSSTDFSVANISEETKEKLELIATYGYNTTNHRTDKYYAATQELIWRELGLKTIYWTTEKQGGDAIDLSKEKNEILRLIEERTKLPSFTTNEKIKINVGTVTLEDSNNILQNYDIVYSNADNAYIDGNKLNIHNSTAKDVRIMLKEKNITTGTSFVYIKPGSQNVGTFMLGDPGLISLNFELIGGSLEINKKDMDTNLSTPQGDATLKGAEYDLLDENRNFVTKLITNENGTYKTDKILLPNKKYILKETKASNGYELDTNEYIINITSDNLDIKIDVLEKVIERKVEMFKVFASDKTQILKGEPNITFDVFLKSSNKKVVSLTTDENGYMSTVLPYGTYIFKQINTTPNHEKVKDFEITIDENSSKTIYKVISNAEIKAKLKLVKIDNDSNNIIIRNGIKFKIKNIDTNEYVCQTITYPTQEKICVFETNNGMFITPYVLNSGNYQIEELEEQIIDGYVWNSNPLRFSITDDSEFIYDDEYGVIQEVKFSNKQVKGEIEINKYGEEVEISNGEFKYNEIKLDGVEFELYANGDLYSQDGTLIYKDKELITTFKTVDGYYKLENLYLGKYYLIEKDSVLNHVIDSKPFYFELKYKDQYTDIISLSFDFKNYLPKGTLEFTKTDLVSGNPIPNTWIEIYTDKDELIFSGYTDENGKIIINDLFVGKGYIIEKESADGYQITDEIIEFEILENGQVIKAVMTNEKIIEVPKTELNEFPIIELISGSLILFGIGVIIYAKKKKRI